MGVTGEITPKPERCEICKEPPPTGTAIAMDHCHETMVFRGWLCVRCNMALGAFRDRLDLIQAAVEYLKRDRNVT